MLLLLVEKDDVFVVVVVGCRARTGLVPNNKLCPNIDDDDEDGEEESAGDRDGVPLFGTAVTALLANDNDDELLSVVVVVVVAGTEAAAVMDG